VSSERLSPNAQRDLLEKVIARCKNSDPRSPPPVIVFDLDGTLMDNRPRTIKIMHELADRWASREPSISAKMKSAGVNDLAYLFTDSLMKIGISKPDLLTEGDAFWRERFFFDAHLVHDIALPGAVSFARDLYAARATLLYLTGRDLPNMGLGTFRSLRDLGFPIGVAATEIILKPDAAMPDEAFKRALAPQLTRVGEVIAAFDNEPGNCNVFAEAYPKCTSVLVDTQFMPGPPPLLPQVAKIADFSR
jgi:hypothetical protein